MSRKRVYVAGPYEKGYWGENIARAIEAGEELHRGGYLPFIPHTHTALWSVLYPKVKGKWLELDFGWLDVCDALVRLPGESEGSDQEVEYAKKNDIPVYFSVEAFIKKHKVK